MDYFGDYNIIITDRKEGRKKERNPNRKWQETNLMTDGNYPNNSDFYGSSFLFLELFYYSATERC